MTDAHDSHSSPPDLEAIARAVYAAPETLRERLSTVNADDLAAMFKQLVDKHWWIDPAVSDQYADLIIQTGQLVEEGSIIALGTMAKGDSQRMMGNTRAAWQLLNEAGEVFLAEGDRYGWARTCIGRVALAVAIDEVPATLALADEAEAVFREHEDLHMVVRLIINRAFLHDMLGEHQQALATIVQTEEAALQLGAEGKLYLGAIYINKIMAYVYLGDLVAARATYETAKAHFETRDEPTSIALAQVNQANVERLEGNYREALRLLYAAKSNLADRVEYIDVLLDMAQCSLALNRYNDALTTANEALERSEAWERPHQQAETLCYLAIAHANLGNPEAALAALDEAAQFFTRMDAPGWLGVVHLQRSRVALELDRVRLARDEAQHAIERFEQSQRRVNVIQAQVQYSRALLALGHLDDAREVAQAGLAAAQERGLLDVVYTAQTLLGKLAEADDNPANARDHYRAALDTIDALQRNLTITLRTDYMTDKNEAMIALVRLALAAGDLEEAFLTLERAKSQTLTDYLVNRESLHWHATDQDPALREELTRLRSQHHVLYHLLYEPHRDDAPAQEINVDDALEELHALEARIQQLIEQMYLHIAQPFITDAAQRPTLAQLQAQLDAQTTLIEYVHDGHCWYAFVLTADDLRVHDLPISLDKTHDLIDQHAFNIDCALSSTPDRAAYLIPTQQRLMQKLYNGLLAPIAETALTPDRQLIIVPYGVLHYLPFNLLHNGDHYLIDCCDVAVYPQAGLLMQDSPQRGGGMRLLAHSLDGGLPGVLREADLLTDIMAVDRYQDDAATRDKLQQPPMQILHLGTHGQHRLDQPELSYIRLAQSQLYTDDLLQHDLSYELVTLSACETGRSMVGPGDELIGLGRGFLIAGAGAVLASLWRVEDTYTTYFMQEFYQQLAAGMSKAQALRSAQHALLRDQTDLHPAFWGAFQLVGDAAPLSTMTTAQPLIDG